MSTAAPVVVTLVSAGSRFDRDAGIGQICCAHPYDVFPSLLDMGPRAQALQYARAVRPSATQRATWALVACEQEPDNTAAGPGTADRLAARSLGAHQPRRW